MYHIKTSYKYYMAICLSCPCHNIIHIHNNVLCLDSIIWNILIFSLNVGIFHIILSVPHNIVVDLNNVMVCELCTILLHHTNITLIYVLLFLCVFSLCVRTSVFSLCLLLPCIFPYVLPCH